MRHMISRNYRDFLIAIVYVYKAEVHILARQESHKVAYIKTGLPFVQLNKDTFSLLCQKVAVSFFTLADNITKGFKIQ